MDNALYITMNGAQYSATAQAVHANNLANVNTPGFRADFEILASQVVTGDGFDTSAFAITQNPGSDFSQGQIVPTGRDLDVAVQGRGWIAVQIATGGEAYTRAGSLHINSAGILVTDRGNPVLGNGGPIALPPAAQIEIAGDGTISVLPLGQTAEALAQIDRIRLVNPPERTLQKGNDGLFYLQDDAAVLPDANVRLASRSLESSNVNAVSELTKIISFAREFEMQIKMMNTANEIGQAGIRILQPVG
ncbi:MAG: flagellar basal body rod protein FlgF [Gammaproteobacteria bacterium]